MIRRPKYKELYWKEVERSNALAKENTDLRVFLETGQYPGASTDSMMREIEQLRETCSDLIKKNERLEAALLMRGKSCK